MSRARDVVEVVAKALAGQPGAVNVTERPARGQTLIELEMAPGDMSEEAIGALETAARSPRHRFEAGAMLARLYRNRQDWPHAIEWFERAAEAPAPGADAGRALLYDLGSTLELSGDTSRALAVFLELRADAGEYRDVAARVDRLGRVQTGG